MVIKSDGYDEMWDTLQWIAIMQLPVTAIFALHPAWAISHKRCTIFVNQSQTDFLVIESYFWSWKENSLPIWGLRCAIIIILIMKKYWLGY